jgi:hypothetical protein
MTSKEAFDIEAARRGRNLATRHMVSSFTYRADVNAFCRGRGVKPDLFDVKDYKENRRQLVVNHGIRGLLSQPIYNQWKRKELTGPIPIGHSTPFSLSEFMLADPLTASLLRCIKIVEERRQ